MPRGRVGSRTANPHGFELLPYIAPPGTIRAFTYRRKSKEGKEDDVSLDEQDIACRNVIVAKGWVHVGDAWDNGAEGPDPDRPGYKQAIKWGREDKYDMFVVWRSDRAFRGVAAAGPLATLLQDTDYRIGLESVTDHFDSQYLGINAFQGDMERQGIRRRTMDTRLNRARRGELMHGTLPYWIERDEQNHGIVNPERGDLIVELIRRYVADKTSTRELARWMRLIAPPTLSYQSAATWSTSRITDILKMTALVGRHPYSQHRYTRGHHPETGNRVRHRIRKAEGDIVYVPVPPLLHDRIADRAACAGCDLDDRPTFEEIEHARSRRHQGGGVGAGRPEQLAHPLRTLVWCGVCYGRMTTHAQRGYISRSGEKRFYADGPHLYVRCPKSDGKGIAGEVAAETGTHRCRVPATLKASDVYSAVQDELRRSDLPERIEQAAEAYSHALAERAPSNAVDELKTAHKRAADLEAKEILLYQDRPKLSPGAWDKLQTNLAGEQQIMAQRIAQLEREITHAEEQAERNDTVGAADLAAMLRRIDWSVLTEQEWDELVRLVVRKVTVDAQNHVSVELRFRSVQGLHIAVSSQYETAICNCAA